MSSTTRKILPEVLKILALPSLDALTDAQVAGEACIWSGEALTAETAIELGEQLSPLSGSTSPMRWFPRACRACVGGRASHGLYDHCSECRPCTARDIPSCPVGRGLALLTRKYA